MKFFKYSEFDSPDLVGSGKKYMNEDFVILLDNIRELAKIPFVINSGFRTKGHNKEIKGRKGSSHLKGLAVDIHCVNDQDRLKIVLAAMAYGVRRIGIGKTFIHLDIDTSKNNAIWVY